MLLSSNVEDDKMISVMIRMIFDDRSARQVSDILIIRIGFFFFLLPLSTTRRAVSRMDSIHVHNLPVDTLSISVINIRAGRMKSY